MPEEKKLKYKLTMVQTDVDEKGREKNCHCKCQHEVCEIGSFETEEALEKWARENRGEIKKC